MTFDEIRDCTFTNCKKLTTVSFPYGMTTIGRQAFYGCESLETITFPYGLTTIGDEAFAGCTTLGEIYFDENLQQLGVNAFGNCSANLILYLKCTPPQPDGDVFSDNANVKLVVSKDLFNAYMSSEFWSNYEIEIAE